jgi:methanogenic corrinoid protein MtbC1
MPAELKAISRRFTEAILRGDRKAALGIIDALIRAGRNPRQIMLDVMAPALWAVGEGWQEGRLTVAEEHLATAIVQVAIAHLDDLWAVRRRPRCGRVLVGACPGSEQHELGLRIFCDLAEDEGWNTYFLGGAVPVDSLAHMVGQLAPDAVALSVTMAEALPDLQASVQALRALPVSPNLTILAGGYALAPVEAQTILPGADLVTTDLALALDWLMERFHVGR